MTAPRAFQVIVAVTLLAIFIAFATMVRRADASAAAEQINHASLAMAIGRHVVEPDVEVVVVAFREHFGVEAAIDFDPTRRAHEFVRIADCRLPGRQVGTPGAVTRNDGTWTLELCEYDDGVSRPVLAHELAHILLWEQADHLDGNHGGCFAAALYETASWLTEFRWQVTLEEEGLYWGGTYGWWTAALDAAVANLQVDIPVDDWRTTCASP